MQFPTLRDMSSVRLTFLPASLSLPQMEALWIGLTVLWVLLELATASHQRSQNSSRRSLECCLNGYFDPVAKSCTCKPPWQGSNCSVLKIKPSPSHYAGAYGQQAHVASWGGGVIQGGADGLYHLYVAIMKNGCGLKEWKTNSYVIHAVAKEMLDEFVYNETVIGAWTHNPTLARATEAYKKCPGCLFLFHIGQGVGRPLRCDKGERSSLYSAKWRRLSATDDADSSSFRRYDGILMGRWAKDPYGPWTNIYGPGCENPAPAFHSNGTLFMLCKALYLHRWDDIGDSSSWTLVKKLPINETLYKHASADDIANLKFEGGFLYFDEEDNFHVIGHLYDMRDSSFPHGDHTRILPVVSLMAYSSDGYDWQVSDEQPFTSVVTYENGTKQIMGTMERPHFIFNSANEPQYLLTGVSTVWPCRMCPSDQNRPSCVFCKVTDGIDSTLTFIQELDLS